LKRARLAVHVCFLALALGIALAAPIAENEAQAAERDWGWSPSYGKKKKWRLSVEGGVSGFTHYNRATNLSTPPESLLAELRVVAWYKSSFAFYGFAGTKVLYSSMTAAGAGVKYPFLAMQGPSFSMITGISMNLHLDGYWYSARQQVAPESFEPSGIGYRFGGSIDWGIGKKGLFLDTTMMASKVSGNFFLMPFVGLGYQF
jgi:hypothetical protein